MGERQPIGDEDPTPKELLTVHHVPALVLRTAFSNEFPLFRRQFLVLGRFPLQQAEEFLRFFVAEMLDALVEPFLRGHMHNLTRFRRR